MHKMAYPQEIEVWYTLPLLRKHLALALVGQGWTQKKVAKALHVTEAAISQYKQKRAQEALFDKVILQEIHHAAVLINHKEQSLPEALVKLSRLLKEKGIICKIHRQKSELSKKELPCIGCDYG